MTTPGLEVRGGAGGTAARLDDLREGVRRLRAAADALQDAAASVRWADAQVWAGTAGAVASVTRAQGAVGPLLHGPASLPAHAAAVLDLAQRLERTVRAYEDAEGRAGEVVRALLSVWAHVAGDNPLTAVVTGAVVGRALVQGAFVASVGAHVSGHRPDLRGLLLRTDAVEPLVQVAAGLGAGLAPGTGRPAAVPAVGVSAGISTAMAAGGVLVPALARRPLRVTPRLAATRRVPPPDDAGDLLERVGALYPPTGTTGGTVGVDRLDHPDGTRSWVVAIPGTQAGTLGTGGNPMDMATNVQAMGAVPDDVGQLVTRALEQSGARPDEPVLLAGHSQGGMVAMALAGSAAFTARHRVAAVLTAGSPVATMPVRPGTAVLHLEHRQDLVPALDGWPNPDRPDRTTAVRDLSVAPTAADRWAATSPTAAHALGAYVGTARVVTAAGGPSVREWERAAGEVLGGAGTTAVHREFTGERAAPGGQVLAPGPDRLGGGPGGAVPTSAGSPR